MESHPLGWLSRAATVVAKATRHSSIAATAIAAVAERYSRDLQHDGGSESESESESAAMTIRQEAAAAQQRASAMDALCEPAW